MIYKYLAVSFDAVNPTVYPLQDTEQAALHQLAGPSLDNLTCGNWYPHSTHINVELRFTMRNGNSLGTIYRAQNPDKLKPLIELYAGKPKPAPRQTTKNRKVTSTHTPAKRKGQRRHTQGNVDNERKRGTRRRKV